MMQDKYNFEDKILDDLIIDALDDLCPDFEDLMQEAATEPSDEFKQSMDAMFHKERTRIKRKHLRKVMPRIAAAFAIFLVAAFFMINSASAWKEPIFNFIFMESGDGDHAKVDFNEAEDENDIDQYLPGYVPEGYELVGKSYMPETEEYFIQYQKQSYYFSIIITKNQNDFYSDINSYKKTTYNNFDYYTDKKHNIIWTKHNVFYYIQNNSLQSSEILKIADSIK